MQYIQVNILCERRFYEKYISRTVVTRQEISPLIWIFLMNTEQAQIHPILKISEKIITSLQTSPDQIVYFPTPLNCN